ncbi:MAG: hypothetical protein GX128_03265 [Bacteroidales bacterium]|jgi:hypothetical protein|nr:hypothetical protein [Bacteroidales bacterium]
MKYYTKKETKIQVFEGKETEFINYSPKNEFERLYYLHPPPEPTIEGKVKHLIIKLFEQLEAERQGRLKYHFDPHEFLIVQEVDSSIRDKMLSMLANTLAYYPKELRTIHEQDIRTYIETFETKEPLKTEPNTKDFQLSNLITHNNSTKIVEAIKIQYKNIKGKRLKLLLIALQELNLIPTERIATTFHNCCKKEFNWDIASYSAMNDTIYNELTDKTELEGMKQFIKNIIGTN